MPARATSEYNCGKDEYVTIRNGLAPNQQLSLASHGDGEYGTGGFHVWLMAEPAHRRIEALDNISEDNILDSAPKPFTPSGRRIPAMSASATAMTGMRSRSTSIGSRVGGPI